MTESFLKRYSFDIVANDFIAAGKGSSTIKNLLKSMGIEANLIRKIAITSYEAEINIVIHSYGGQLHCDLYEDKIVIVSQDTGPGIKDVELALTEGYSTATESVRELGFGAGMGLPNMMKYSDDFEITSSSDGTVIKITILL
ncbi:MULTISPECIES: ATP-binding protein [unclassified Sedimentibacter]|uniref:ATP-binding protein n=1 Tax=unclassified Sedimentibacter TaxID=2649220 RepID=UPI0027E118F6|nr:ATP-binding protein [Sedimentibacter sp. MB35-C1]WMJ75896.1 ATP-binding protein [Sedimentibacter sp. MB35-C1]